MGDSAMSENVAVLTEDNAIEQLESAADSGVWKAFGLPSGKTIIVTPDDDFETLRLVMQNQQFADSLCRAVDEAKEGNVEPFDEADLV